MNFKITSNSSSYTISVGEKLSKILSPQDIILLSGELGGGKTTFISGLAKGLGITEDLSSPSFTIMNVYNIRNIKLVHADFYRLTNIEEIISIGIEDYIYDKNSIVLIEWGEKIKDYIDKDYLLVEINYIIEENLKNNFNNRVIYFKSNNLYWDRKLKRFKKLLRKI